MLVVYILILMGTLIFGITFSRLAESKKDRLFSRLRRKDIQEKLRRIMLVNDEITDFNSFCNKKIWIFVISICVGCILAIFCEIMLLNTNELIDGNKIKRNDYSGQPKEIVLKARNMNTEEQEKINVTVSEKKYTEDEIEKLAKDAENVLIKQAIADNESLDYIYTDMSFPTSLSNYPFSITWRTDNPLLINSKGEINRIQLEKLCDKGDIQDGILTGIHGELRYENYSYSITFYARIYKQDVHEEITFSEYLSRIIEDVNLDSYSSNYLELPNSIEGVPIAYEEVKSGKSIIVLIMTAIIAVALYFREDQELNNKLKERDNAMINEYPVLVNKFVLFYTAGLTTRRIWSKVCSDYRIKRDICGKKSYLYEEMLLTEGKLEEGLGELSAYEEFSARIGIYKYRQFISLVEQSVDKGRRDLTYQLESEVDKAFADRKNRAKELGEEAGTKLLFPMMMMLMIVLIVVMVPAFVTFRL